MSEQEYYTEDYMGLDDLSKTIRMMTSDDWKQRFIAEYAQLVTRIDKLLDYIYDADTIALNCPVELLNMQLEAMNEYEKILEIRATLYGIDLSKELEKMDR